VGIEQKSLNIARGKARQRARRRVVKSAMRARSFDHLVLNVSDVEVSLGWYMRHLGLEPVRLEEWRRGEAPFPSLRINDSAIIDFLSSERSGENLNHFCLVVDDADLHALHASGVIETEGEPRRLYGARGIGWGLYVIDPDGNRVELRHYGEEPRAPHAASK
jgi:catechol 2,3-dioxygenase-like lactoylglutathione lyase family enzyme